MFHGALQLAQGLRTRVAARGNWVTTFSFIGDRPPLEQLEQGSSESSLIAGAFVLYPESFSL